VSGLDLRLRGFLEGRPLAGPQTVHVDLANACDLACVTCWNHAPELKNPKSAEWKRQRIERALFERAVDEVAAAGAERVILGGSGEPFTHPDAPAFVERVKARGLKLTLITNGKRCDFAALAAAGVDQVLLNVASATPQTYTAYHPGEPEESFGRLIEGARKLSGAVNLVQVINRVNAHELPQMVELAAEVGARCSFKLADAPRGTERFALQASDRRKLLESGIPQARKRAKALRVRHNLEAFADQLQGVGRAIAPPRCFAGYLYSRIWVDGRIFFCCEHLEVGSLADGTFESQWRGERYQKVRDQLRAGRAFPGCARCGKFDMNWAAEQALSEEACA
jgi:MoaA/NifB/PqqE/SkfB family radical SAM enzyme